MPVLTTRAPATACPRELVGLLVDGRTGQPEGHGRMSVHHGELEEDQGVRGWSIRRRKETMTRSAAGEGAAGRQLTLQARL